MLFNSQAFVLFFLPAVFGLFLYVWHRGWSRAAINLLTVASLFFYGWWNVSYIPLIIGSVLINFLIAGAITRLFRVGSGHHRRVLILGIAFNLVLLGYFKYANFFVDTLNGIAGTEFHLARIMLPLAISFFTVQQISFLVDTWKKKGHRYSLESYAAYVTFFPHEIAGPIIRHHELIPQFALDPWREGLWERIGRGLTLFAIGLVKKVLIADGVAGVVSPVFITASKTGSLSTLDAWIGITGFAWQIFFDFSAYTDMALGVALLFGYKLPINFDCPYRSRSVRELWQRWHMTLSRFLRDYLFVPLATSKWLPFPRFTGMVITMVLAGLWHGASWNFAVWGLMQGLGLATYTVIDRRFRGSLPALLGWAFTMLFWFEGGPLFRGDSFGTALVFYKAMHGAGAPVTAVNWQDLGLLAGAALVALIGPSSQAVAFERLQPSWIAAAAAGVAVFVSMFVIGSGVEQEFIYFQF